MSTAFSHKFGGISAVSFVQKTALHGLRMNDNVPVGVGVLDDPPPERRSYTVGGDPLIAPHFVWGSNSAGHARLMKELIRTFLYNIIRLVLLGLYQDIYQISGMQDDK